MRPRVSTTSIDSTRNIAQIDVGLLLLISVSIEPFPNHFRHFVLRVFEDLILTPASEFHLGCKNHPQDDHRLYQRSAKLWKIVSRDHEEVRCDRESVHYKFEQLSMNEA